MGFLDNLSKTLSDVSQTTIKKSKEVANTAKLNLAISEEERKIEKTYTEIGRKFYEMHSEDCENEFVEMVVSINEARARINEYQENIKELKGITKCPECGADIQSGAAFCPNCGYKVVTEEAEEAKEEPEEKNICENCGAKIEEGYNFCTKCGAPADFKKEPVVVEGEVVDSVYEPSDEKSADEEQA